MTNQDPKTKQHSQQSNPSGNRSQQDTKDMPRGAQQGDRTQPVRSDDMDDLDGTQSDEAKTRTAKDKGAGRTGQQDDSAK